MIRIGYKEIPLDNGLSRIEKDTGEVISFNGKTDVKILFNQGTLIFLEVLTPLAELTVEEWFLGEKVFIIETLTGQEAQIQKRHLLEGSSC